MNMLQIFLFGLGIYLFASGLKSIFTASTKKKEVINLFFGASSFLLAVCNPFIPVKTGKPDPPMKPPVISKGDDGAMDYACNHIINSSDVEDYSINLNPEEYLRYSSNYQDFSFYYPPHLFNRVDCRFDSYKTDFGNNIEAHTFLGSDGTEISFELSSREEKTSEEITFNTLYNRAVSEIKSGKKEIWRSNKDILGFSVTGFDDKGRIIYRLIRIYEKYVMDLRIVCPGYTNEEDKRQKRYVQDCIIRKCGFTNPKWKDGIVPYSEFENN